MEETTNGRTANDYFTGNRFTAKVRVRQMRPEISREPLDKKFQLLRSISHDGFAQLTYRESLRDIETCLRALKPKLYHAGIRGNISRNTLAKANEKRDWRIFADFAQVLIGQAKELYAGEDFGIELDQTAYALDSTTIDLCLSLFPWAKFRKHKGAIKLHTLLDLRGCFPSIVIVTTGKIHDVNILDQLAFETGAFYIMDRGYLDFERLHTIQLSSAYFVTRAKKNFQFSRKFWGHQGILGTPRNSGDTKEFWGHQGILDKFWGHP